MTPIASYQSGYIFHNFMKWIVLIMVKTIDMAGKRFGRLAVIDIATPGVSGHRRWNCICECGNGKTVLGHHLRDGVVRSCGCLNIDVQTHRLTTHDKHDTPEYRTWRHLKARCLNPKSGHYAVYGGRGILICARWIDSFENFFADMGVRPSAQHSIDRIDNNGDYEPGNCRWATVVTQNRNRSTTVITMDIAREMRSARAAGIRNADIVDKYGVSKSVVCKVLSGQNWKEDGRFVEVAPEPPL